MIVKNIFFGESSINFLGKKGKKLKLYYLLFIYLLFLEIDTACNAEFKIVHPLSQVICFSSFIFWRTSKIELRVLACTKKSSSISFGYK